MRSIWQKQSGGLFRSKCLISLCSITHFCRWSSTFFSGVAVLIAVLGQARYKKTGQF